MPWRIFALLVSILLQAVYAQRSGVAPQLSPDIEFELARLIELRSLEEYNCTEAVLAGNSDSFETRITMHRLTAHYVAIVTGRNNKAILPAEITLVGQNNKSTKVAFQSAPFGAELSLQPKRGGEMRLRVRLEQKTAYRVLICNMEASVYRTKEILPKLEWVSEL